MQKARFDSQRKIMTEIQYASAKATQKLLSKTFDGT